MRDLDTRISQEMTPEVFAVASRLYAEKSQEYSLQELMEAGAEAQIPPEFIQQAYQEIQIKRQQAQERRKKLIIILASVGVVVGGWGIWTYNSLASAAQKVDSAWAQVENQFQRRADLIPNLVRVTEASAKQERDLAALLTRSRTSYLQADTPGEKAVASTQVSQAINQFQNYVANNPQLQSSQAYINLQYELAGTENRIAVERMRYNQAIQAYNQKVKVFPNSVVAKILGFESKPLFKAEIKEVPRIN
ncbi:LemA family protein [Crinalium epipsammum PCC 9333]|uniref:LemA family protein n=1 Tax=Crinalium epipsammum PCC 9333 TaxID=1173022 RepID=K9W2A8_9CYAN|nr:LemA family protein [Crinalium epipsammum]AFZ13892.1 LemA family protein [Crinalium epipsammum PCC 9333]